MTDTPDNPSPQPPAFVGGRVDYLTRRAEYQARAEEARPANKTALFDALAAAGISQVVIDFDGYGDSGQIESISAYRGDETVELPPGTIGYLAAGWDNPEVEVSTMTVSQVAEEMAYDLLAQTHGGWEINDGAYGEFTFDVATRLISLDYNERYTTSEYFSHEF